MRRWVWVAALSGLLLFAYVGAYAVLRATRELGAVRFFPVGGDPETWVLDNVSPMARTWRLSAFRPCIAVEEWWRDR